MIVRIGQDLELFRSVPGRARLELVYNLNVGMLGLELGAELLAHPDHPPDAEVAELAGHLHQLVHPPLGDVRTSEQVDPLQVRAVRTQLRQAVVLSNIYVHDVFRITQ